MASNLRELGHESRADSVPSSVNSVASAATWNDQLAYPTLDAFATEMDFSVDISNYRGPMDLLLYLVKKHEVDVADIPIASITDQYIQYLEILEQLDVDAVGDFIETASLLVEIKSRSVLPQTDEEDSAEAIKDDPRDQLVQRLLEYKAYKDAASMLSESGQQWQQRYTRVANDLPTREVKLDEQPIHEVELWDLVSAMGRIMRESQRAEPLTNIVYDDTPIHVHMQTIHRRVVDEGRFYFTSMFQAGMHKSKLIGVFLAVLELARNYGVRVEQTDVHGEMVLTQGEDFQPVLDGNAVFSDDFEQSEPNGEPEIVPLKPR